MTTIERNERYALGCCLLSRAAISKCIAAIGTSGDVFSSPAHTRIYAAIVELYIEGTTPDIVSLSARLEDHGTLAAVGGHVAIAELFEDVATSANIDASLAMLQREHKRRALIEALNEALVQAVVVDPTEASDALIARLSDVHASVSPTADISTVMMECADALGKPPEDTLRFGYKQLDLITGGMQRGHLVYLAAQTSRGKTAFALRVMEHAARAGVRTLMFSLEMTQRELGNRLLATNLDASVTMLRNHAYRDEQLLRRVVAAAGELSNLPIAVHDQSMLTVNALAALIDKQMRDEHCGLVVVDYIGLLTQHDSRSRNEWLGVVSQRLKAIAKQHDCVVLALTQLNRDAAKAQRTPELYDLRDSGNLEQDANMVLMLHSTGDSTAAFTDVVDVMVRKNRGGPTGTVPMLFDKRTGRFTEVEAPAPPARTPYRE